MSAPSGLPITQDGGSLSDRLKRCRQTFGFTQRRMALQLGVTQQTIARWENGGSPQPNMVPALVELLDRMEQADQSPQLAEVVNLRSHGEATRSALQEAFLEGCIELMKHGERLPDRVLVRIAEELF